MRLVAVIAGLLLLNACAHQRIDSTAASPDPSVLTGLPFPEDPPSREPAMARRYFTRYGAAPTNVSMNATVG